jgi:hypothetical protein
VCDRTVIFSKKGGRLLPGRRGKTRASGRIHGLADDRAFITFSAISRGFQRSRSWSHHLHAYIRLRRGDGAGGRAATAVTGRGRRRGLRQAKSFRALSVGSSIVGG